MNKKILIVLLSIVSLILVIFFSIKLYSLDDNVNNNTTSYSSEKTSTNNSITKSNFNIGANTLDSTTEDITSQIIETEISTFTTNIYNKEEGRQNNIAITCSSLNGVIIKNGDEFSFCNTVGPATIEKGYMESDIFRK